MGIKPGMMTNGLIIFTSWTINALMILHLKRDWWSMILRMVVVILSGSIRIDGTYRIPNMPNGRSDR